MLFKHAICRAARPLHYVIRPALQATGSFRLRQFQRTMSSQVNQNNTSLDQAQGDTSGPSLKQEGKATATMAPTYFNDDLAKSLSVEHPGDEPDDVVFGAVQGVRTILLNRPKKLNSLNGSMARKIIPRLREWEKSQLANMVVIKGEGRAFCAGGDVAALAKLCETSEGQEKSREYFGLEYNLDHMIATTDKPYIAFLDGITMGGGVGLSVHAPFRIATENTVFAMPETTIGFFPDVGASFFLPKMDGQMGAYLALTSEQLKGVDVFYHGIATHYIHSTSLPALEARLGELQFDDSFSLVKRQNIIASTIEEFTSTLPSPRPTLPASIRNLIDQIFASPSIMNILNSLTQLSKKSPDPTISAWASATLSTLYSRSPTSVLVTLRMLHQSTNWTLSEAFTREHTIAAAFMSHSDFIEGITAKLIRRSKERPAWSPSTLQEASSSAVSSIDAFFPHRPLPFELLRTGPGAGYQMYPHRRLQLPAETEILQSLKEKEINGDKDKCVKAWVSKYDEKVGVREKVEDVLERQALRERIEQGKGKL